ncbi:hypothetical protein [Mycobacterium sp. shizuoka-1]|uniref:hypothetical protein n=1 Tax=Mycobacterium sp. shizuoka-1 TaxID=2039281 RepID=UPI000C0654ED|nr:hypothetical protein [Mycobacterium sp. shizuoka-1]GAY17992.1 hypothetical protein MSZK_47180 [Mycobacterium sp. shizuoka-1]
MNVKQIARIGATAAVSAALSFGISPVATAWADGESGAVTGAGFGPTLGVGDASSYTGNSTSNTVCGGPMPYTGGAISQNCAAGTLGVGDASSYTGAGTTNSAGGTASLGVGDVNSYTGGGTPGIADNGTNSTTRTVNFGPGHP